MSSNMAAGFIGSDVIGAGVLALSRWAAVVVLVLSAVAAPCDGAWAQEKTQEVTQDRQALAPAQRSLAMVVPFARDSRADLLARVLARSFAQTLSRPVAVDNHPGFGGTVALAEQAKGPPGHSTLLLVTESQAIAPGIRNGLSYDLLKDFDIVAPVAQLPGVLVVHNDMPFKTAAELIAAIKARPRSLRYGSAGIGSIEHMDAELLAAAAGTDLIHVPYRNVAPMITDLLATFIQMAIVPADDVAAYVRAGNLRALAVTSAQRSPCFPDLPTLAEAGLGDYEATSWFALAVRKGASADLMERLTQDAGRALRDPAVAAFLADHCMQADGRSAKAFTAFIAADTAKWSALAQRAGIKADFTSP